MNIEPIKDVVPAIFTNRAQAEAAVEELRQLGFDDDEFGLVIPDPSHHRLMDKGFQETVKGLVTGAGFGAPFGSLAGIGLIAFMAPGIGALGLGGVLLGAHIGGLWGAFIGSYVGLVAEIRHIEDIEHRYEIPLQRNEILIVVLAGHQADTVRQIMECHSARCCPMVPEQQTAEVL